MFDVFELSRFSGKPLHLFIFQRQSLIWRFANWPRDYPLGGETFVAAQMERSALRDSVEAPKNNITIKMPYLLNPVPPTEGFPSTQVLGDIWRPFPPSDRIFVSCMSTHYGDDQAVIEWTGRVVSPEFTDTELTLTCEPTRSSGRRTGTQKRWQLACWKTLYQCGVDPALHAVPAVLVAVDGLTLTAAEFATIPGGKLAGGYIEWARPDGLTDYRTIMAHDSTAGTIQVSYGALEFAEDLAVVVRRGCAHNWADCEELNNTPEYGGAPYKPTKNPMGGMPVW